jgi:cytochrome c biogenesis protein CcdA
MLAENINIWIVVAAAIVDSVNPCVFGVLIFLIAFMNRVLKSRRKMLIGGLIYTTVVYLTYLILGFGILQITVNIGVASLVYFVASLIAIMAGLIELKDFFWYGRWFSLQMMPGASSRIKYYTAKIEKLEKKSPALLMGLMAILGVFVVLVELPCTGAPYFAILGLLAQGAYSTAVPLLMLYNLIFVLPLIIVILVAYFGATSDRLEAWRQKHKAVMRLAVGLFLIALGIYMLVSLPPLF